MRPHPIIWVVRAGFAGWVGFEFLNLIKILHFTLDFSWFGLILTSGFIWAAIEITSSKLHKHVAAGLPWPVYCVGLLGVSWDALGDVSHLYARFSWYDQAAHFGGGMTAALVFFFIFHLVNQSGKITIGPKLLGFFAIASANLLGVLYELEEYAETVIFHNNRLGDALDTPNDLMWNLIGSLCAVLIASWYVRRIRSRNQRAG